MPDNIGKRRVLQKQYKISEKLTNSGDKMSSDEIC